MSPSHDIRRPDKVFRYKPLLNGRISATADDYMSEYYNILSMITSMVALMCKYKVCAWMALFCSAFSFANGKIVNDESKQILSGFTLSASAILMCYVQDPKPLLTLWEF